MTQTPKGETDWILDFCSSSCCYVSCWGGLFFVKSRLHGHKSSAYVIYKWSKAQCQSHLGLLWFHLFHYFFYDEKITFLWMKLSCWLKVMRLSFLLLRDSPHIFNEIWLPDIWKWHLPFIVNDFDWMWCLVSNIRVVFIW